MLPALNCLVPADGRLLSVLTAWNPYWKLLQMEILDTWYLRPDTLLFILRALVPSDKMQEMVIDLFRNATRPSATHHLVRLLGKAYYLRR